MKTSFKLPELHGNFGRGTNGTKVSMNGVEMYFSYKTLVAFRSPKTGELVVHKNDWSKTTGGHLSAIDGGSPDARKRRVDADEFARLLEKHTKGV